MGFLQIHALRRKKNVISAISTRARPPAGLRGDRGVAPDREAPAALASH